VVSQNGQRLLTRVDVTKGEQVFLSDGMMQDGSIFGQGAYLGPDFTADYLHRAAVIVTDQYGGKGSGTAQQQVITDFKTNRYDASSPTLTYTNAPMDLIKPFLGMSGEMDSSQVAPDLDLSACGGALGRLLNGSAHLGADDPGVGDDAAAGVGT
jgi:hypothetical protein